MPTLVSTGGLISGHLPGSVKFGYWQVACQRLAFIWSVCSFVEEEHRVSRHPRQTLLYLLWTQYLIAQMS